jgi:5-methyltetrahydropteroyltriglutamate--homocysteine methyltransferase
VASDTVETPEEVAEVLKAASRYVKPHRLIACTNCGMAPMDRAIAEAKLKALVQGAALARAAAA